MSVPDPAWQPTDLPGVWRRRLTWHEDARGAFSELWRASWTDPFGELSFVQANLSRSAPRVLRGLHLHRRQADLWTVLDGPGVAALVDVRGLVAGTASRPAVALHELEAGTQLYIPRLVAHGFYARNALLLAYLVTNEYDGSDELGFAWDDADAAVPWPDHAPILSERDASNPPLRELAARLRGGAA
ncbi:MAG TPA: dTDP-4-dehydrorhamnose 3,5-epimerase family protein [Candidatus Dormibacteraeota bacterium]|nr:dTDP-4-dehydrorhamnose 3,5-epimerase family protein [Candidatus Dormibacteraeota bacterium]